MQIFVCKLVVLLRAIGNKAATPKQCLSAAGTTKMLQQAGRIMKLTAVLLLGVCMQIYAAGYGQKITLSERDVPIEKVLKKIQAQTSYKFLYTSQLLSGAPRVTVVVKDATVQDVLDLVLKGQMLDYEVSDETVVIKPRKELPGKAVTQLNMPDPIEVRGVITDENGAPAAGVNVMVKGTSKGTTTNLRGEFVLRDVSENAVLLITSVGYDRQEVLVKGKTMINTQLKVAVGNLDEMQVIAYGKTSKRFNTGNVITVKASDIEKQPINNPLLALQGRVPGLFVTQNTGIAGGGITVRIQGLNSIENGNDPLYIIDGVPLPSQLPRTGIDNVLGNSGSGIGSGNPLSFINPADIESIEVLKDADATSIYGSRAANGAILITTKKGKAGKTTFDVNLQKGIGDVVRTVKMLNTRQYLDMRYEAFHNDHLEWTSNAISANDLKVWDTTRYTDWQKVLLGETAHFTNIISSVTGGSSSINYLISGTFRRETTVFPFPRKDFADEKGAVRFNLNSFSSDRKLKIQFVGNYLVDDNRLPQIDITETAVLLEPNAPALINPDGTINWAPDASGRSTFTSNPMINLYTRYRNKSNNIVSNLTVGYKIIPGLEISNNLGYVRTLTEDYTPYPKISVRPELREGRLRAATYGNRNLSSWITEPQINYNFKIGNGNGELLVGATILQSKSKSGFIIAQGHPNDQMLENIYAATSLRNGFSIMNNVYKYNAVFTRLNYNWGDKYILNFTARRDGSSRFGGANRFHNFGSVGAAWIFSNEKYIKEDMSFISFGKLRANYGTTGSDQIGDYNFIGLYSIYSSAVPYQGSGGLVPAGIPNPHLQWEETRKLQFGIDLGILGDRILANFNYARNRSSNQLLRYALPLITGFPSQLINLPALIQNTSFEFTFSSANVKSKLFAWTSQINFTVPQNKLIDFPNLNSSTLANNLVIGSPISVEKYFNYLGVDAFTGEYKYESKVDPYNPTSPDDNTLLISFDPKYYGGFKNNISFNGVELDFLFQFVKQKGPNFLFWNGNREPGRFAAGVSNQPVTVLNRWQKVDDNASIRKYSTISEDPYIRASNYNVTDASYVRLKNMSLSWGMQNNLLRKVYLKNVRIYIQAQNLFTITKYKGLDPETRSITSLPPLRVIMLGLQLMF